MHCEYSMRPRRYWVQRHRSVTTLITPHLRTSQPQQVVHLLLTPSTWVASCIESTTNSFSLLMCRSSLRTKRWINHTYNAEALTHRPGILTDFPSGSIWRRSYTSSLYICALHARCQTAVAATVLECLAPRRKILRIGPCPKAAPPDRTDP